MSKIIVALDYSDHSDMMNFVDSVTPEMCKLKIGKEAFTRMGPGTVAGLTSRGFDVFLDLKYHDIPNTVENACRAASDLGVWMVNVHAMGGLDMMEAARKGLGEEGAPLLTAVTVLTSLKRSDLIWLGISESPTQLSQRLANMAYNAGCDGIICSPHEVRKIKETVSKDLIAVTPGIRLKLLAVDNDDQQRTMTPEDAIAEGSDYIVLGRPITQAAHPWKVLKMVNSLIGEELV